MLLQPVADMHVHALVLHLSVTVNSLKCSACLLFNATQTALVSADRLAWDARRGKHCAGNANVTPNYAEGVCGLAVQGLRVLMCGRCGLSHTSDRGHGFSDWGSAWPPRLPGAIFMATELFTFTFTSLQAVFTALRCSTSASPNPRACAALYDPETPAARGLSRNLLRRMGAVPSCAMRGRISIRRLP